MFRSFLRDIMVMKMEEPLDEEHDEKPGQHPAGDAIDGLQFVPGMGEQMKDANPQHEPGDEADRDLETGMGETNDEWDPASRQRRY